jgi:hypothetical protein
MTAAVIDLLQKEGKLEREGKKAWVRRKREATRQEGGEKNQERGSDGGEVANFIFRRLGNPGKIISDHRKIFKSSFKVRSTAISTGSYVPSSYFYRLYF